MWLKKKNLNLVETRYGNDLLYIFVYKRFFFNARLKDGIINYYKKTKDSFKVIQKFGVQKTQLNFILAENNLKVKSTVNTLLKKNLFSFLLGLHYKKFLCMLILMAIESFSVFRINISSSLIQKLALLYINMYLPLEINSNFLQGQHLLLRKINGSLKLKLITKGLENLIFKLKAQKISIKIKNIYLTKGFFRVPYFGKQVIKPEFRFKFFTIFVAMAYTNSFLMSEYISDVIKKGKQHRKNLQIFTNFFERIFYPRLLMLSGFQLRVSGKLGGKLRKSKYHYKIGKVQLHTFKNFLSYSLTTSYTKFGVISIKV